MATSRIRHYAARAGLAGALSAALAGCATHYVAHTGTPGSAYVTHGNDLLHCNVINEVPHCWTAVSQRSTGAGRP